MSTHSLSLVCARAQHSQSDLTGTLGCNASRNGIRFFLLHSVSFFICASHAHSTLISSPRCRFSLPRRFGSLCCFVAFVSFTLSISFRQCTEDPFSFVLEWRSVNGRIETRFCARIEPTEEREQRTRYKKQQK